MTEAEVLNIEKNDDFRRQLKRINGILLVVLAALLIGPATVTWWINRQLPVVNTVSVGNVRLLSPAEMCAGDVLTYAYSFSAQGSGVLIRDRVLWRMTPPPKTMIFSTSRRFIISEPIDQELTEAWHLPATYLNPETDANEVLPTGDYRLIFAISSPSRSMVVTIGWIDFTLKDCPKGTK